MSRRQMVALITLNFTSYFTANALLPLLPIYARSLGASVLIVGVYLGIAFAALTLGALSNGWMSQHLKSRRTMLALLSTGQVPALLLMGSVSAVWQLALLTAYVWFAIGSVTATVTVLVGLSARSKSRGRTFGMIALAAGLSQIVAGLSAGFLVERAGFAALFAVVAAVKLIEIGVGLWIREPKTESPVAQIPRKAMLSRPFWVLVASALLAYTLLFIANLARPITMQALGFTPSAISSMVIVSGLAGLVLPFLMGWLSDRVGRQLLLVLIYLVTALGAGILSVSAEIEQFWLATALLATLNASMPIGFAFAADHLSKASLSVGLSRLSAVPWFAGVVGYVAGGLFVQSLGAHVALSILGVLPLISTVLILAFARKQSSVTSPVSKELVAYLRTTSTHPAIS